MRISESQRERMGWAAEELKSSGDLLEEIISRNPTSSGEELVAMRAGGSINDKDDVNKETFRASYGEDTYEVEALEPSDLEAIVEEANEQTIDVDGYNEEIEQEEKDSRFLEAKRKLIMEFAASLPAVEEEED